MGVENWSIRSKYWDTSVVHVDGVTVSFAEYREQAGASLAAWLKEEHPDLVPEGQVVTLDWAEQYLPRATVEEALEDGYCFWDTESGYLQDASSDRYADLCEGLQRSFALALPQAETSPDTLKYRTFDDDKSALVLAKGRYAQAVIRGWQSDLCIGIAPTNELENYGPFIAKSNDPASHNQEVCEFLGRCWAVCDPKNQEFARYVDAQRGPVPVELRPTEVGLVHNNLVDGRLLDDVVARVVEQARQLDAEEGNDEALSSFQKAFGIEPAFLLLCERDGTLAVHVELVAQFNATPAILIAGYQRESGVMEHAMLDCMASMDEKPTRADTSWTSRKVDLSAYRHVVVVQLDGAETKAVLERGVLTVSAGTAPSRVSVMPENVFDRTVTGAVGPSG